MPHTQKMVIFFIVFHVLERTENGFINGWRRGLNSHKLLSGEKLKYRLLASAI